MLLPDVVSRSLLSLPGTPAQRTCLRQPRGRGHLTERAVTGMVKRTGPLMPALNEALSPHGLRHALSAHAIDHGASLSEAADAGHDGCFAPDPIE